jgi:hypothetical protein
MVLELVHFRATVQTPSPEPEWHGSSDFETPTTLRQINKVADRLDDFLQEDTVLDDEFKYNLGRFMRGSLIAATELVQTKRDLSRTKAAELASLNRRAMKNRPLKSGGVLSVDDGRGMVTQRAENDILKAKRLIESHEKRRPEYGQETVF